MNYQEELRAKLDAVRPAQEEEKTVINTQTLEEKLLNELDQEFVFSQYDLQESDLLRTLKVMDILARYGATFSHPLSLKLFYVLARIDVISMKNLHNYMQMDVASFKTVLKALSKAGLLFQNEDKELELTMEGKSLASRLGVDIYF